ncbi:uncharacterized protein [Pagrus major]|uniref:uncharacterized protein n=2 Tax=Pagrus major TaxID=143350 RepID=UPI003CC88326
MAKRTTKEDGAKVKHKFEMPRRISPLQDAICHVISRTDKTDKLEVKYINAVKGRGVFAKGTISRGQFVAEYRGDMINDAEYQSRRRVYHPTCAAFMFAFKWRGKTWCIDASRDDGSLGRLVNDEHRRPNCKMKRTDVNGKPHLCLFALDDIQEGEEITYHYGDGDCPWRTQMTSTAADDVASHDSSPSLSVNPMDDAAGPSNTQQMTSTAADDVASHDSSPSLSVNPMDDAAGPSNTQQMASITAKHVALGDSHPSSPSLSHMDDARRTNYTLQEMTSTAADDVASHDSSPSLSVNPMDDAAGPSNTQQMTSTAADDVASHDSSPSLSVNPMDDAAGPSNTQQAMTVPQDTFEVFVPRLRRTRRVIMKDTVFEDSDELYCTTPESGEDFIPDTTSKSDTDSEASLKLKPTSTRKHQYVDNKSVMWSPICDSTTPDSMEFDKQSHTSKVRAEEESCSSDAEEEPCSSDAEEEPCSSEADEQPCSNGADEQPSSSQSIGIVVVGPCKRKAGKRVYDKRHYCLYCSKPYAKMARHLEHAHDGKSDVARALSFTKGSKERKKQLDYIRNKGNYAHNASVMQSGKGELVPFKRPPKQAQGNDFMHCAHCQGLYTRKVLWRHMRNCQLKPGSVASKPGKNRVQSMCTYTGPVPTNTSEQLWGVITSMNPDPIAHIVKNDQVIIDFGQHLLNKKGISAKNKLQVREKMRELGRLIHSARRVTSLKNMEDFISPKKYMETIKAVKLTCGYESESNRFLIPSLANKLGNSLVKISKLLKAKGLISNDEKLVKNASNFEVVHQEKWHELISATALRNIREAKWNMPSVMPFTKDVQKMHAYLTQEQDKWSKFLSESPSTKAWKELTKVCLVQLILFNRRREGEVASMPLSAFLSRDTSDPHDDLDWALSEVEKKLCRHFTRIVVRGKRGRPVPILLTPKMLNAIELLVSQREACGVLKDNDHMFARPGAMTHFRGSDCFRAFAKQCGADCPRALTSTKLRKHAATLSTVLNMTNTEMDQLANFLGHDIRVHREFYRLPEKTLQLAKVSKLLMALEQGRVAEFHGKTLDEVEIDPDEKLLDSDEDDENMHEGNPPPTDDEETLPPPEKNETPLVPQEGRTPPSSDDEIPSRVSVKKSSSKGAHLRKRRKPPSSDDEMPSGVGAKRSSSKGKATQRKKRPWQETEVQAVERHMKKFITSCIVPGKMDCEKCLRAEPEALQSRDWQTLKFYVYNRISASKKKLQCN